MKVICNHSIKLINAEKWKEINDDLLLRNDHQLFKVFSLSFVWINLSSSSFPRIGHAVCKYVFHVTFISSKNLHTLPHPFLLPQTTSLWLLLYELCAKSSKGDRKSASPQRDDHFSKEMEWNICGAEQLGASLLALISSWNREVTLSKLWTMY